MARGARLYPECKRALIEQSLKIALQRASEHENEHEPDTSQYCFLRILLTSKSLLNSSIRNKIYRFAIDSEYVLLERTLYLTSKSYKCEPRCFFIIPAGLSFQLFFRLFHPQFIGINIGDHWSKVSLLELRDFLAVTGNAKLGLFMHRNVNGLHIARLIFDIRHRIHVLKCDSSLLDSNSLMPPLDLEHLYCTKVESIQQIVQILRNHKMRSLKLDFYTREFSGANDAALSLSDLVQNNNVKVLSLKFVGFEYEEVIKTLTIMTTICPKLREVNVDAKLELTFGSEDLVNDTKNVVERMEEMYKQFSVLFKKFNVRFLALHCKFIDGLRSSDQGSVLFDQISVLPVLRPWASKSIISKSLMLVRNCQAIEATFVRNHDRGNLMLRMRAIFMYHGGLLTARSVENVNTADELS